MLGTILVVILILALFGALPRWSHSREWGYVPTGGVGFVLVIVVILGTYFAFGTVAAVIVAVVGIALAFGLRPKKKVGKLAPS